MQSGGGSKRRRGDDSVDICNQAESASAEGHKNPRQKTLISSVEKANDASPRTPSLSPQASPLFATQHALDSDADLRRLPEEGMAARHAKEIIVQAHELDFKPRLNTSSYVNVVRHSVTNTTVHGSPQRLG